MELWTPYSLCLHMLLFELTWLEIAVASSHIWSKSIFMYNFWEAGREACTEPSQTSKMKCFTKIVKGLFKKYFTQKTAFFTLPPPMSRFVIFSLNPSLPSLFLLKWQAMAWNRRSVLYISLSKRIKLYKSGQKGLKLLSAFTFTLTYRYLHSCWQMGKS